MIKHSLGENIWQIMNAKAMSSTASQVQDFIRIKTVGLNLTPKTVTTQVYYYYFFSFLRSREVITPIREELGRMFLRTKQRNENRRKFLYHCVQANFATWIFMWTEQQSPVSEWRILQCNIYRSWWLEQVNVKQNYHALCWKQICWLKLWCTNYVIFALISCWITLDN